MQTLYKQQETSITCDTRHELYGGGMKSKRIAKKPFPDAGKLVRATKLREPLKPHCFIPRVRQSALL